MHDVVDTWSLRLHRHVAALAAVGWSVHEVAELAWELTPPGPLRPLPPGRTLGLTLLGTVHGNELAGLGVLDSVLGDLRDGLVTPRFPIGLAVGNPAAARVRRRYLDRDLNRSFARTGRDTREDARARELERLLDRTAWLLDVHQTSDPSVQPFFIFPWSRPGAALARAICASWPIVTHWDDVYSPAGRCSDEYVLAGGGVGVTVELGEAGLDPYQIGVGAWACGRALLAVDHALSGRPWRAPEDPAPIHTWAEQVPWPDAPCELAPWVRNFTPIHAGQVVGTLDGEPLLAPRAGRVLFPVRPRHLAHLPETPTSLYRILREVAPDELP